MVRMQKLRGTSAGRSRSRRASCQKQPVNYDPIAYNVRGMKLPKGQQEKNPLQKKPRRRKPKKLMYRLTYVIKMSHFSPLPFADQTQEFYAESAKKARAMVDSWKKELASPCGSCLIVRRLVRVIQVEKVVEIL